MYRPAEAELELTAEVQSAPEAMADPAAEGKISIQIARTESEVEELRPLWSEWKGHRDSEIDFFLQVVRADPETLRPHVILLLRNGRPDALLVGRLERKKIVYRVGYVRMPGIPTLNLTFVYGCLRGNSSERNSLAFVQSIIGSLGRGEADVAYFHHPDTKSSLYHAAIELPGFSSRDHAPRAEDHYFMQLPDSLDQVYLRLSKNHRADLRRKAKKLLGRFEGRTEIKCFRTPQDMEIAYPLMEAIAKKTYQRGLGVGFQDTPLTRQRLNLFAQKGWMRTYLLYLGGVPCAFWAGAICHGVFCSDYLAFDPDFGDVSPGTFLMTNAIGTLCRERATEIDFGHGEGRYKEQFGNLRVRDASVQIFATTPKGIALAATHTTTTLTEALLKNALRRSNLMPTIKKLWRRSAAKNIAAA